MLTSAGTCWPWRRLLGPPRTLGLAARTTRTRCFDWEDDGSDLEAEILQFMDSSSKPEAFPTRIELVESGRVDLVEAVVSRGGWLTFGWAEEEEACSNIGEASSILCLYPYHNNEPEEEESGIEGILRRLARRRTDSFGFDDTLISRSSSWNECFSPPNELRVRLQNLELELSCVLSSVRCNGEEIEDAWEFQGNNIMKAQRNLRSTRAILAALQGKLALAILEAQGITEEKQKRIDDAERALRLLCSTCIVFPNPASEVFLAGSFDGWATLRKMEKNSAGVFSLLLQLYPGTYEVKFVVDGEWRVDPERPSIYNNGHLNNLVTTSLIP